MAGEGGGGVSILIVEDNPLFREILRGGLTAKFPGAVLCEAETVAEGHRTALRQRPDVAIIDVGLPDGNGLDLLARLRSDLPGAALAVCTMHDLPEYREGARCRGAECFFRKHPLDWEGIEAFVRDVAARGGSTARADSC